MELLIEKQQIEELMTKMDKIIDKRSSVPALTHLYLDVQENEIIIKASNTNITIVSKITSGFTTKQTGTILLPSSKFVAMMKNSNDNLIQLKLDEKQCLSVKIGKSKFKLPTEQASHYPNFEQYEKDASYNTITMNFDQFSNMIKEVKYAHSKSETKPILTGLSLKYMNNALQFMTCDSFRAVKRTFHASEFHCEDKLDFQAIIPFETITQMLSIVKSKSEEQTITLEMHNRFIIAKQENFTMILRLIDGAYPQVERLFQNTTNTLVKVEREEILEIINRSRILETDTFGKNVIVLDIQNKELSIKNPPSAYGEFEEECSTISIQGEDMTIGLNSIFLQELVSSFPKQDTITFAIEGALKNIICKGEEGSSEHVICPIRLG